MRTLVLNAGYEPLSVVSFKRAIVLVLNGKASVLADSDLPVVSSSLTVPRPLVIVLSHYVRLPYARKVPVSRRGVLRRDQFKCAYCGNHATTVDHVVPRAKGGPDTWENLVASCLKCNNTKGDRTLNELHWTLSFSPSAPESTPWYVKGLEKGVPEWDPFLLGRHSA